MKRREDKRMVKLDFFGHIFKNFSTFTFGAWPFFLVHIWFTPSEGPKGFVNRFIKISDHGCWATKSDHGKRLSSILRFHVPWCKLSLRSSSHALYFKKNKL